MTTPLMQGESADLDLVAEVAAEETEVVWEEGRAAQHRQYGKRRGEHEQAKLSYPCDAACRRWTPHRACVCLSMLTLWPLTQRGIIPNFACRRAQVMLLIAGRARRTATARTPSGSCSSSSRTRPPAAGFPGVAHHRESPDGGVVSDRAAAPPPVTRVEQTRPAGASG